MSYEGYREQLCMVGHYLAQDAYAEEPSHCPHCGAPVRYTHRVDQTNGRIPGAHYTQPGPKTEVGFDDVWHTDHHGNRYATKLRRYTPSKRKGVWVKVNSRGCAVPPYEDDLASVDTRRMAETRSGSGRSPSGGVATAQPATDAQTSPSSTPPPGE